jgi:hypothetical protein
MNFHTASNAVSRSGHCCNRCSTIDRMGQTYPNRSVRIIVPFTTRNLADLIARVVKGRFLVRLNNVGHRLFQGGTG